MRPVRACCCNARRRATTVDPEVFELARRLENRAQLALLTNNGPLLKEGFAEAVPKVIEMFGEHAYCAYEFGFAKPDPRVFTAVANRFELPAEQVLFIDDHRSYVDGASQAGLCTHHFTGAPGLEMALEQYGLL